MKILKINELNESVLKTPSSKYFAYVTATWMNGNKTHAKEFVSNLTKEESYNLTLQCVTTPNLDVDID
jgi:hypothetical protein